MSYEFLDNKGNFKLDNPESYSYLYFPVGAESGMMGAVTPELGGDLKTSQNTFVLEPTSADNLHNNRSTRNFWIYEEDKPLISAMGASAYQHAQKFTAEKDEVTMYGGLLYQRVIRKIHDRDLTCGVTTFVPVETSDRVEMTKVTITNTSMKPVTFTPTAAVPLYGRSADNIRDHRDVTKMLNRMTVTEYGIVNNPTLTFDERGHRRNLVSYGFFACKSCGCHPVALCPIAEDFIGEGGAFDNPRFPVTGTPKSVKGDRADGFEAMGAATFEKITLDPGASVTYTIVLAIDNLERPASTESDLQADAAALEQMAMKYLGEDAFDVEFDKLIKYWDKKNNISFHTGDKAFDNWMYWVGIQPMLRRIYGCSFLPHHDYGKGGRGWRDLWQDCLALIMMDPSDVRSMLIDNFGGVRVDGTNATIIGSKSGEFVADRNGITRVWMDHAMWPFMTMDLYIKQSGDISILDETAPYFIDRQVNRGEVLLASDPTSAGAKSAGTVLEHLLLQNLAAFFDIGEHGHMKLRGADWNDALDMGKDKGESVAFTAAYCGNYRKLAGIIRKYGEMKGVTSITAAKELAGLVGTDLVNARSILTSYCDGVQCGFSGETVSYEIETLAADLEAKANAIEAHIQANEWFTDKDGYSRFNGYYDNDGNPLENISAGCCAGSAPADGNMMLTSQVFTVMSGIATDAQVEEVIKSADKYLYDEALGGYKLNTNFHEIKTNMGRMFGFSYGQKENGAVFSHMTVMFGNSLYTRGFKDAGWKVIGTLYRHATDFPASKIYPGVPEYFDPKGRGVYHYLTGAASWLMLTVLSEMFGVKGEYGSLKFVPQLVSSQFDAEGKAGVDFEFNGKPVSLTYKKLTSSDDYKVGKIYVDGAAVAEGAILDASLIGSKIEVELI